MIVKYIDGKDMILLGRRYKGMLDLPAMTVVGDGELPTATCVMGCKQKLDIDVAIDNLLYNHVQIVTTTDMTTSVDLYFFIFNYNRTPKLLDNNYIELVWSDLSNLPMDLLKYRRTMLENNYLSNIKSFFSERRVKARSLQ